MINQNETACKKRTTIGGQALIEGIMMRGPKKQSVVVRDKSGELVVQTKHIRSIRDQYPIFNWPIIRGSVILFESLKEGVSALTYSSEFYPEEDDPNYKPGKLELWLEKKLESEHAQKTMMGILMVISFAIAIGMFFLLPTVIAGLFDKVVQGNVAKNIIEGIVRIIIFLAYLFAISQMKDIRRVFAYHGAEHKSIFCYEAQKPLTVENVRTMSRFHPRCGTSFLFVVMIVAIIVFSCVTWSNVWVRLVLRLVLIPVIIGISYEFNRLVGRHDNWLTRILTAPGLWLQRVTTCEPDDSMIEVAIAALREVIPEEEGLDNW